MLKRPNGRLIPRLRDHTLGKKLRNLYKDTKTHSPQQSQGHTMCGTKLKITRQAKKQENVTQK